VASPPCQEFSYMAMPWSRAKAIAAEYRSGKRDVKKLTELFDACFRIQREAIEAAGHFIPMVVENVRGAQPWIGKARWNFGSYYLWGDVPALMPITQQWKSKGKNQPQKWQDREGSHWNGTYGLKVSVRVVSENGPKQAGISGPRNNGKGDAWFQDGAARHGSKSKSRKAASATIAKIPLPLARWIAKCWKPNPKLIAKDKVTG